MDESSGSPGHVRALYYSYINTEVMAADVRGGKRAVLDFMSQLKTELAVVDQYARWERHGR
ncbi:hypothetical protein GCM10027168_16750 [Streptomyces capparidis]